AVGDRRDRRGLRLERAPRGRNFGGRNRPAGKSAAGAGRMTATTAVESASPGVAPGRAHAGPGPTRTVVGVGFWVFLLSDIVMFSGLFAAYAVLWDNTAGGPTGRELFNLRSTFIETACLLVSSYTAGLGALSAERQQADRFYLFAVAT